MILMGDDGLGGLGGLLGAVLVLGVAKKVLEDKPAAQRPATQLPQHRTLPPHRALPQKPKGLLGL